jgi:hypothetical protein
LELLTDSEDELLLLQDSLIEKGDKMSAHFQIGVETLLIITEYAYNFVELGLGPMPICLCLDRVNNLSTANVRVHCMLCFLLDCFQFGTVIFKCNECLNKWTM